MSDSETKKLQRLENGQSIPGSGYFQIALAVSFLLAAGAGVLLGVTIRDLDKCENNVSAHCPYFQKPNPSATGNAEDVTGTYQTEVVLPNKSKIPLDPYPYSN